MMKTSQDDATEKKQPVIRLVTLSTCFFCATVKGCSTMRGSIIHILTLISCQKKSRMRSFLKSGNSTLKKAFPLSLLITLPS